MHTQIICAKVNASRAVWCILLAWFSAGGEDLVAQEVYRHPSGLSFTYATGWTLQETDDAVVMLPPDAARDDAQNPLEVVIWGQEAAPGVETASDPRVVQFFDQQIAQQFAGMRRSHPPTSVQTQVGEGVVLRYEGAQNGLRQEYHVYAVVRSGLGVYLMHMARADLVDARRGSVRAMFASLRAQDASIDPSLVGQWLSESTDSSVGGGVSLYSTTYQRWQFGDDGQLVYEVRTWTRGGGESRNDDGSLGAIFSASSELPGERYQGRYSIGQQGALQIWWETGDVNTYTYRVFGEPSQSSLKLQRDGNDKATYYARR